MVNNSVSLDIQNERSIVHGTNITEMAVEALHQWHSSSSHVTPIHSLMLRNYTNYWYWRRLPTARCPGMLSRWRT